MTTNVEPISDYWREGTALIEKCLTKAEAAAPADAPIPLVGTEAALWHRAQAEAYRHALEMMGVPMDYRAKPEREPANEGP